MGQENYSGTPSLTNSQITLVRPYQVMKGTIDAPVSSSEAQIVMAST